jgi:hypothetical protein
MLERKKIEDDLLKLAKAVISPRALVRKHKTAPPGEKPADKSVWLEQLEAAIKKLIEAEVCKEAKVATVYDLFRKTLKEDPELQWDRIMKDMHTKDPWKDLMLEVLFTTSASTRVLALVVKRTVLALVVKRTSSI